MEINLGTPAFIDVEVQGDQFMLTEDLCRDLISLNETKTDSSKPVAETSVQSNAIPSQEENKDDPSILKDCLLAQSRRVRCPECTRYTAENEEKMLRHIKKVHRGENPFQCYMCDYSTYNKSLFEEHVRIHQGIKPFKCSYCDHKSASKKNVKKHELIHRPDNPLKCPNCNFIARHPKALSKHKESHSQVNWLKYETCKFKFPDVASFKKHERTHRLKCRYCDYTTCTKPYLTRHLSEKHNMKQEDSGINGGRKESFTCQICRWTSSTMAKILLHLIHHPNQVVDESIDISILRKHGIMP